MAQLSATADANVVVAIGATIDARTDRRHQGSATAAVPRDVEVSGSQGFTVVPQLASLAQSFSESQRRLTIIIKTIIDDGIN